MEIVSTMGNGSLGRELDLKRLIADLQDRPDGAVEADFHNDSMATVRFEPDGPAYTIFRTGTFQIRGSRTPELLREASDRFRQVIENLGVEIPEYSFELVTAVFMHDFDREINLEALSIGLGLEQIEYEPEQFPGLIYRPEEFEVTLLVFASGKVIIGGTTDREHAADAISHLEQQLANLGIS